MFCRSLTHRRGDRGARCITTTTATRSSRGASRRRRKACSPKRLRHGRARAQLVPHLDLPAAREAGVARGGATRTSAAVSLPRRLPRRVVRNEAQLVEATSRTISLAGRERSPSRLCRSCPPSTDEILQRRTRRVRSREPISSSPAPRRTSPPSRSAAAENRRPLRDARDVHLEARPEPSIGSRGDLREAPPPRSAVARQRVGYASKDSVFIAFKRADPQNWPANLCNLLEQFHPAPDELTRLICTNVDVKDLA